MDEDLQTLLRTSKIFASLSSRAIKRLLPKFRRIELEPNEILYHQGDPADSIEIVLSGKLSAILTTANGETKVIGEIDPGETSGELGALSNQPRSTTIVAAKNSTLFSLPSDIFVELCHAYPSILFAIINPIVTRSQKLVELISSEKIKKHIAIIPANDEVSIAKFAETFIENIPEMKSILVLSDYSDELKNANREKIQAMIEETKAKSVKKLRHKVIYILKSEETPLAQFCFEKADTIYIVGDNNAPILLNNYVIEKLNLLQAQKVKPELILLHEAHVKMPHYTASWLELTDFGLHHHVRINRANDYARLIRFIRNKAVGVVLSGGGTRGWGHVGAIKALVEAGIPIDAIGGTSVGSIVAASYAITESAEETLAQFSEVIEQSQYSVSWRNLTWPAISLFNAKGLTNVIKKLFGEAEIEDLWLPYFCISTNLAKYAETIHFHGSLWESVRSSVSIPGVIPPMLLHGELHLDGGLLNNLPVDIMRKFISHRGSIIAIDLGTIKDESKYNFPPILPFWKAFLAKFHIAYDYKFPRFIDTFLRSLLAGSSAKSQQNGLAANILIDLDLSRYPMLQSKKKHISKILEIGYTTTLKQLKEIKRLK